MIEEIKNEIEEADENAKPAESTPPDKEPIHTNRDKKPIQYAGILGAEEKDDETKSFADILYDEITSVIGGDNPNQFFCMGLPGTILDPTQYSYDVDKNPIKPAHVKANESKLANKLFDAAFMSASDNGKHLTTQYMTALNMLTPKLNGKLFDAKTKLREVLMTPYPYNFEDGSSDVLTLEQVFYKLYSDYVAAKEAWAQKQLDKKNDLKKEYADDNAESNAKINDEYLEWYGIVAESEELVVEEKLGKVLGVFSPGDMEIITGILESGSGRELAEARATLENVGELNPNGGYTYPVTLYPENWFNLLDTSFTSIDLLESPAALSQRLHVLEMQKSNITANINNFLNVIPDVQEVTDLKKDYETCEDAYKTAFNDYLSTNESATMDMFKTVIDIIASNSSNPDEPKTDSVSDETIGRIFGVDLESVSNIVEALSKNASNCINAQQKLVDSSDKAVTAALKYFTEQNMLQLKSMLEPLQQQLSEVNEKITEQKQKIALASAMQPTQKENEDPKLPDKSMVAPNSVPDGFTQIIIDSSMSSLSNSSSRSSSSSESSCGASFFFGGYSSSKSHYSAISEEMSKNDKMEIQIGMSVAKVEIDREWFDPGVFMLTTDMYNTSSEHIAPTDETDFHDDNKQAVLERMQKMNDCVFPCYPTSFVVAKDVTIKFVSQQAISTSFAQSVEDHSSKGGGFFIFGGSSSSASSSSKSSSTATSSANSVTVRFTAPQILGYYLEAIAPDKSTSISNSYNMNTDYISIFEFITAFKKMLDDHNSKYNKNIMNS
jgi:hypothetical protein